MTRKKTTDGAAKPASTKKKKKSISTPTPHWQVVENVVAVLEGVKANLPGMVVTQKAQVPVYHDPTRVRDVDVLVRFPMGERPFSLGIEVKAHGRPIDVGKMGQIVDLWRDVKLDRFVVVSTSGFSGDAVKKAEDNKIEMMTLEQFEHSDFLRVPVGELVTVISAELVSWRFTYYSAELAAEVETAYKATGGTEATSNEIVLRKRSGAQCVATEFLMDHGTLEAERRQHELLDQELFGVDIPLLGDDYASCQIRHREIRTPDLIQMVCRFRRKAVPELRFRSKDLEVVTFEPRHGEQVTIVAVPNADGKTRQVTVSTGPSIPKDVKVERES